MTLGLRAVGLTAPPVARISTAFSAAERFWVNTDFIPEYATGCFSVFNVNGP